MNDIKNKIRAYNKREPITDKRFAFSNDLISRAIYTGSNGRPDKRFDTKTEGLSLWIRESGIKTFYAFRKREMFNRKKLKLEKNNVYKKIFKYEDNIQRNLAAFIVCSAFSFSVVFLVVVHTYGFFTGKKY